jgi:hypothetical protein
MEYAQIYIDCIGFFVDRFAAAMRKVVFGLDPDDRSNGNG